MDYELRIMIYEQNKNKKFYPDYLAEIIVSILVALEVLIILAFVFYPSIGREIDFTRPFQPKPEWYFLWLYKLVSYFPGDIMFVGTVIIPLIFVILFLLIPFIDRGEKGRLAANLIVIFLFATLIILTLLSI